MAFVWRLAGNVFKLAAYAAAGPGSSIFGVNSCARALYDVALSPLSNLAELSPILRMAEDATTQTAFLEVLTVASPAMGGK
jgi:hypothetical protein